MLLHRRQALRLATAGAVFAPGRTFAAPRAPSLDVTIIGDWGREGHDRQRAVGAAMGQSAELLRSVWTLSLGDNFYDDGVSSIEDPQWQSSYEQVYSAPSLRDTPWWSILGNHDYRGNVQAQLEYGTIDKRWRMPARYYARSERLADGTSCDLFYIDTNPFLSRYRHSRVRIDDQDPAAQLAWLERGLAASGADWKIVVGHHPIHTADGPATEEPELIASLRPLLEKYRVRVYLNGHIHNFQHVRVAGIDYITNGAGSKLSHVYQAVPGSWSLARHGFMTVSLSRDRFDFQFLGASREQLYQAALDRTA